MTDIVAFMLEPERSLMRFERLEEAAPDVRVTVASTLAEALPALADAEVLISIGIQLGADAGAIYAAAPKLKWVQSFGSGTDNINGHPALAADVAVTNVHGIHGPQLSEAAFAAMLSFARHLPACVREQDRHAWTHPVPSLLNGATVGIFGLGAIAEALAPRCKAFGMTVVGISGTARALPNFDVVQARDDLIEAVRGLDYLVLLTPLTPRTRHIVDARVLAAMKPSACLVNLARGGVVDEAALVAALDRGEIAGAVLDVFEREPLPTDNPLWSHPKVIIWPHTGGFHAGYPDQVFAVVAANLARYRAGGVAALLNRVN